MLLCVFLPIVLKWENDYGPSAESGHKLKSPK